MGVIAAISATEIAAISAAVLAIVAVISFLRRILRDRKHSVTVETWRSIWSSDKDTRFKIGRAKHGVPVDFFDLLNLKTRVEIHLLSDRTGRVKWFTESVNWGDTPLESDSIELDFDQDTEFLEESLSATYVRLDERVPLDFHQLYKSPPRYRYRLQFPLAVPPDQVFSYEFEYRARNLSRAGGFWWEQEIRRVTNLVEVEIRMVSGRRRIKSALCRDIIPGGQQVTDFCDVLPPTEQYGPDGEKQIVSVVRFRREFPPLGHTYRIETIDGDL